MLTYDYVLVDLIHDEPVPVLVVLDVPAHVDTHALLALVPHSVRANSKFEFLPIESPEVQQRHRWLHGIPKIHYQLLFTETVLQIKMTTIEANLVREAAAIEGCDVNSWARAALVDSAIWTKFNADRKASQLGREVRT